MSNILPAAIAFFALGANLVGTSFLLLFEPRSRALRWYALFELDIMVWLALQGWSLATDELTPGVRVAYAVAVHLLPALFVLDTLVDIYDVGRRAIVGMLALAFVTVPLTLGSFQEGTSQGYELAAIAWQIAGWGSGLPPPRPPRAPASLPGRAQEDARRRAGVPRRGRSCLHHPRLFDRRLVLLTRCR